MDLNVLYRGPLSSCNYGCGYCPFAKRAESFRELEEDRKALDRFESWCAEQTDLRLGLLFTPWGEALVRPWYRESMVRLSRHAHVTRVAIQTNLSCRLDWLRDGNLDRLAFWVTYHPGETERTKFLSQCRKLLAAGARFSVGIVGLREHLDELDALRSELPPQVYVWVNAFKDQESYYAPHEIARIKRIDPHFEVNLTDHASLNEECWAGLSAIAVDGEGTMRRCHFVREPIGNIYRKDWRKTLRLRACPNEFCGCHIGYVHLKRLRLYATYGAGLLERIPAGWSAAPFRSL